MLSCFSLVQLAFRGKRLLPGKSLLLGPSTTESAGQIAELASSEAETRCASSRIFLPLTRGKAMLCFSARPWYNAPGNYHFRPRREETTTITV